MGCGMGGSQKQQQVGGQPGAEREPEPETVLGPQLRATFVASLPRGERGAHRVGQRVGQRDGVVVGFGVAGQAVID